MTTLSAQRLHVTLGGTTILPGIDVTLKGDCLTGLIGPNGAGKSTLLRTLAGLHQPAAGKVDFNGRPLAGMAVRERARAIAYLAQERTVAWSLDVTDVVALGRLAHDGPDEPSRSAIATAIARCDLNDLAARRVDRLSGGERARVLLARALAVGADVFLADEPVAGLDPAHALDVMTLLRAEAERGAAVAVVLHDLTLAARHCHRLILLDNGMVAAEGPPETVLTPDVLRRTYDIRVHRDEVEAGPIVVPLGRASRDP